MRMGLSDQRFIADLAFGKKKLSEIPILCTGMAMVGQQCPHDAIWKNKNGVKVCDYHKLMLDAFTFESRNTRKWESLLKGVSND